jgi:hypothetical protein
MLNALGISLLAISLLGHINSAIVRDDQVAIDGTRMPTLREVIRLVGRALCRTGAAEVGVSRAKGAGCREPDASDF